MTAPDPVAVQLTAQEYATAWDAGKARHFHHCDRKSTRPSEHTTSLEALAAVAEMAVAKAFGGSWRPEVGPRHYGSDDVTTGCGTPLEVKATVYRTGKLFVYTDTADELTVVLGIVEPKALRVLLAGWEFAAHAKCRSNWNAQLQIPCYQLYQHQLHDVRELPCLLPQYSSPSPAPTPSVTIRGTSGTPASASPSARPGQRLAGSIYGPRPSASPPPSAAPG